MGNFSGSLRGPQLHGKLGLLIPWDKASLKCFPFLSACFYLTCPGGEITTLLFCIQSPSPPALIPTVSLSSCGCLWDNHALWSWFPHVWGQWSLVGNEKGPCHREAYSKAVPRMTLWLQPPSSASFSVFRFRFYVSVCLLAADQAPPTITGWGGASESCLAFRYLGVAAKW